MQTLSHMEKLYECPFLPHKARGTSFAILIHMKESKKCNYILLVEDDEVIRRYMSEVLVEEGYRVETASNGKLALQYLKTCQPGDLPSCIILDLMMPIMTGIEFLNAIQDEHDQWANIPVLVATAKGSSGDQLIGVPLNVGRIQKPMDIEEFLSAVMERCGEPVNAS